jgi:hypothetical protein
LRPTATKHLTRQLRGQLSSYLTRQLCLPTVAIMMVLSVTSLWSHAAYANASTSRSGHIAYHQTLSDIAEFNPAALSPTIQQRNHATRANEHRA